MAKKANGAKVDAKAEEKPDDERPAFKQTPSREEEFCTNAKIEEKVRELMKDVDAGFQAQWDRGNEQMDYWDCYDCILGGKQGYAGNSQIFVPLIHEAIEARVTRFVNQLFPRSARIVDCITSDEKPYDILALLEHYIRKTKLRTQIVPALMRNGDVEGQYNLYVGWTNSERHIAYRAAGKQKIEIGDGEPAEEIDDPDEDNAEVKEDVTYHMQPTVEVLPDCDVLVLPHTANSIGAALSSGGSVTVIRRWSKARLEKAIDDKEIEQKSGEDLVEEMKAYRSDTAENPDVSKKHVDAAGIHGKGTSAFCLLYETWTYLKLPDGKRRLCKTLYGGGEKERILSVRRNPFWNDKCPVLSAPRKKITNVFKGQSAVKFCADLQYAANDAINEAWDSAAYSLMPIVMTDPSKNPRVGSMILNLAAIWETSPKDTQFAQFPQLWKDGFAMVASAKQEIFQVLSVSPAAIAQSTGNKVKRNQAEIANEQQVDILSTADVCINIEDELLTQLLRWFVELDYQYRDREMTVRQYGQMGMRAAMQEIPPLQSSRRYEFRWFGVEASRNAQMLQMKISAMNVVRGIPPEQYKGYEFNAVPIITQLIEDTFGPRIAPEIFQNMKEKLTVSADMENEFLLEGLDLPVHELDEDQEHMQKHVEALRAGDPTGSVRLHMMKHRMQMQKKMAMQQAAIAQMQQGQPGVPGGAGPGVAGSPRQGAAGGMPRGGQAPPGAIHQDRMQDASAAPRR